MGEGHVGGGCCVFISHPHHLFFVPFWCVIPAKNGKLVAKNPVLNVQIELPPVVKLNAALTYR